MKKQFLTPTVEWISLDAQDIIRTSDNGNGIKNMGTDNDTSWGALIPLG